MIFRRFIITDIMIERSDYLPKPKTISYFISYSNIFTSYVPARFVSILNWFEAKHYFYMTKKKIRNTMLLHWNLVAGKKM